MQLDTGLSLEVVMGFLAVLGALWRLDRKNEKRIDALRQDMRTAVSDLNTRIDNLGRHAKCQDR